MDLGVGIVGGKRAHASEVMWVLAGALQSTRLPGNEKNERLPLRSQL